MKGTFKVQGQTVRISSMRRYVVVCGRPADFEGKRWDRDKRAYVPHTFPAYRPEIVRRSDSYAKAVDEARKNGTPAGGWCVVIDTNTGSIEKAR